MRKILQIILPNSFINAYKQLKKNKKAKQRHILQQNNQVITKNDLISIFQKNGINTGETIMLHSSLSKLGLVQNGANDVIDALLEVIRPEGTLVMPAFPAMGFNYDYLKTNPIFDVKNTPSKMGIITETFRKREGVLRSLHPTDSVCAYGKQANYLVKDHFNQLTPYTENSPFYKLAVLNGKILLIGVDLNSLTNYHTYEDAIDNFSVPVYHQSIFTTQLIDGNGRLKTMETKVHNPVWSKKRQCNAFTNVFEKQGVLTHFKINETPCMIVDANKLHHWFLKNYQTKGITLYNPQGNS